MSCGRVMLVTVYYEQRVGFVPMVAPDWEQKGTLCRKARGPLSCASEQDPHDCRAS